MASFLDKVKAALSVGNANSWSNPNAKTPPRPQPQARPQPKVNVAQFQQAMQRGPQLSVNPSNFQRPQRPAPQPQKPGLINKNLSQGTKSLIGSTLQSFPRGALEIAQTIPKMPVTSPVTAGIRIAQNPAGFKKDKKGLVPTNRVTKAIVGNRPIQTSTQEAKDLGKSVTGKTMPTALAVPVGLALSSPGVPGKKQVVKGAAKVKAGKNVNKANVPEVYYHGTNKEFDQFDINRAGTVQSADWGPGVYLTPLKEQADRYAEKAVNALGGKKITKELQVAPDARIKDIYLQPGAFTNQALGKELLAEGYDGARIFNGPSGDVDTFLDEVVVVNPNKLINKGVKNGQGISKIPNGQPLRGRDGSIVSDNTTSIGGRNSSLVNRYGNQSSNKLVAQPTQGVKGRVSSLPVAPRQGSPKVKMTAPNQAKLSAQKAPPQVPTTKSSANEIPLPLSSKKVGMLDKAFRSTRSIIERQGESGKRLGALLRASRDREETLQAVIQRDIPTVRNLKGKDFENFVDAVEGKVPPKNAKVAQAVQEWRTTAPKVRDTAVRAGLDVGDLGETYFPHFVDYDKVLRNKNMYNQAINHLVETGQAKSTEDAIRLLSYARDTTRNRRFGNLESPREIDVPFYDKSPNALLQYLQSSSRRIAQAESFGKQDEKALELIANAGREGADTDVMKRAYDAAVGARKFDNSTERATNAVRRYITTTRLGLGALTNVSQSANTGIVTGHMRTMGAMVKQLDPKQRKFVEDTGVIADAVINEIREQVGFVGKGLSKITAPGFAKVEKFNRSVAAVAGKDYAQRLAAKGDVDTLKNKLGVTGNIGRKLTPKQEVQAARKVVEITQFKVDPQDLPGWASTPGGKLVAQFRTFSYNQSKFFSNEILKPAAKGDVKPLARLLAAMPVGYGLYEVRRKIDGRPEEENKGKVAVESFSKIGGMGLVMDIYRGLNPVGGKYIPSDRRVSMAVGTIGGPAVGQASRAVGAVSNAVQGNADDLKRFGMTQLPIVGTPIANRVMPYKKKGETPANPSSTEPKDIITQAFNSPEGKKFLAFPEEQKKQHQFYEHYKAMQTGLRKPTEKPAGLPAEHTKTLDRFNRLTEKGKSAVLQRETDAEYKLEYAKYSRDAHSGKLSDTDKIAQAKKLRKLEVGKVVHKDIRDLFNNSKLTKNEKIDYLSQHPDKIDEFLKYDQLLKEAGLQKSLKYKNGIKKATVKVKKGKVAKVRVAKGRKRGSGVRASSGSRSSGLKATATHYKDGTLKMGKLPGNKVSVRLRKVNVKAPKAVRFKLPKAGRARKIKVRGA